jgi:hypothetical protein
MRGYPVFRVPTEAPRAPPWERLRTHRWGQFFGAPLGYLEHFTRQSTAGPREVPELEVREQPPSTLRDVDDGPPRSKSWRRRWRALCGVLAAGSAAATTKVEDVVGGPLWGCWRQVRQRPLSKLKTSMAPPWGELAVDPIADITEVEDADGGPPGGCWRQVRQRPPSKLKMSMAAPWGC